MELKFFGDVFRGKRILITGHNGFKGSWLVLWLQMLGAEVYGLALAPTSPSHFHSLELDVREKTIDINDAKIVYEYVSEVSPEVVVHLAAQPLVRESYLDPINTWNTNVLGTLNVLEAVRKTTNIRAVVCITTDKVYRQSEKQIAFEEDAHLGGHDAYSASKAACEILIDSHRASFFSADSAPLIASVRAGNVIGGGDWANERIVPDLMRSAVTQLPVNIRYPQAIRPWQHVLDCLSGYLVITKALLDGNVSAARAWNVGPKADAGLTVQQIAERLSRHFPAISWTISEEPALHEASFLSLNSSAIQKNLGWEPVLDIDQSIKITATWYRRFIEQGIVSSIENINSYMKDARTSGQVWAK